MSSSNELEILNSQPRSFFSGVFLISSGFKEAMRKKSLFAWSLIPILASALAIYFGSSSIFEFIFNLSSNILLNEEWFDFWGGSALLWLSQIFLKILSGFVTFLVFYVALQIIYIPVCSILAEKVLRGLGTIETKGVFQSLQFNIKMFFVGLTKTLVLLGVGVMFFAFSFIPFLNFLPLVFALIILAYDSFDYGLELYGLSFRQRMAYLNKELFAISGHASVLLLLSFIPGLILLTLPFSVIGASLLMANHQKSDPKPKGAL